MNALTKTRFMRITPWILSIVRIAIGWHFLYEGIAKIMAEGWSSAPYLAASRWIFAPLFHSMAESTAVVSAVDFLNIWGYSGWFRPYFRALLQVGKCRRSPDALCLFCCLSPYTWLYVWCTRRRKLSVGKPESYRVLCAVYLYSHFSRISL